MQAIQIKYLPATNTKPSRIKAWCTAGQYTESYNYDLSVEQQVSEAAHTLASRLGWDVEMSDVGVLPNGDWVMTIESYYVYREEK